MDEGDLSSRIAGLEGKLKSNCWRVNESKV